MGSVFHRCRDASVVITDTRDQQLLSMSLRRRFTSPALRDHLIGLQREKQRMECVVGLVGREAAKMPAEGCPLPFAEGHGDAKLFEVLLEGFAAQVNLPR